MNPAYQVNNTEKSFKVSIEQLLKKTIFIYLCGALALDSLIGYLLKYKGLQEDILFHPGQIIRSLLLIALIIAFLQEKRTFFPKWKINIFFLVLYFTLFLVSLYFVKGYSYFLDEIINVSKILFLFIIAYYIANNRRYFEKRLPIIININFIVFSLNLLIGYLSGVGLKTYSYIEYSSKGLFYGGNLVSVLGIVFLAYYLFKYRLSFYSIPAVALAIFNLYVASTKTFFIVPFVFFVFFLKLLVPLNKMPIKIIKYSPAFLILIALGFCLYFFCFMNSLEYTEQEIFSRIERSYMAYKRNERVVNFILVEPFEMISYRRVFAVKEQITESLKHPIYFLFGIGKTGQKRFWIKQNSSFHDAAMDFFNIQFQYGLIGLFIIFFPIMKILLNLRQYKKADFLVISFIIMFFYSFFGGHVIGSTSSGTFFGLFIGLLYKEKKNKRKYNENPRCL